MRYTHEQCRLIALLKELGFTQLCELEKHWHGQDFYLWSRDI